MRHVNTIFAANSTRLYEDVLERKDGQEIDDEPRFQVANSDDRVSLVSMAEFVVLGSHETDQDIYPENDIYEDFEFIHARGFFAIVSSVMTYS